MNFKLSPESIRLLCYQRSQYCDIVGASYLSEMSQIYNQIEHNLPGNVKYILDVGAGMAGIDVFLAKHYPQAHITILDKEGYAENFKSKIGFHSSIDTFGAYHSFEVARKLLIQNGVHASFVDIGKQNFPKDKFDLVVSFLSWGFHYPLSTYSNQINTPCSIICDVRKGTDDGSLGIGRVIYSGLKHERKLYTLC